MKQTTHYEVRYKSYGFSPEYCKTLQDARDYIARYGHDKWMTHDKWIQQGKSEENWQYWVNVYTHDAYIVKVITKVYPVT